MQVVIVDYQSGNIHSVDKAVKRASELCSVNANVLMSNKAEVIANADRVILPGVGAFAACMNGINSTDGLSDALSDFALNKARPILGICVGMQMMADFGLEFQNTQGLGWISGCVKPMSSGKLRIPHMSWQEVKPNNNHILLQNKIWAYFVHSYVFEPKHDSDLLAYSDYGSRFCAIVGRDNIVGTQFHPEKSQKSGIDFLANFLQWAP